MFIVRRLTEIQQRYSKTLQLAICNFEAAFNSSHRGRLFNELALMEYKEISALTLLLASEDLVCHPFLSEFSTLRSTVQAIKIAFYGAQYEVTSG
ncbi:hypothetical protein RB195_024999 [Necator americanus]|uniref:Reverse transcriptase domain-containing protein n=1 Tax=Necator americanus TaxID=51031 RepID=A0ABR1ESM6_NECAM